VRCLVFIISLFPALSAAAQLSAPGNNAIRYTTLNEPVFIYCNSTGTQKGTLSATSPAGAPPYNYDWYRWSNADSDFSIPVKTETGVSVSSADNLEEGGYKVVISGGYDTSYVGWIFLDKPHSYAALLNRTCEYVALKGEAAVDTFFYNNTLTGAAVRLPNRVKFLWSSSPASIIPFPDLELNPQTFVPPLVDVTYRIQVTDSFGCKSESSFFYESIHVKADFSVDPDKGEAPLEVSFTDKSVRGTYYKWEFGDGKDSISELKDPEPHIYYIPGEYTVKLTIRSDRHCIDSMKFEKIVVEPSDLDIPNVFTPNDDGMNDRFIVQKKSLRYLSVEVFSRSGKMVYNFNGEGESLRNWEGWDGKVNNTSADAAPGVYFYIIRALGWDDISYDSKEQRGFVYLYR
jgi:gliding motility-associated-like protein